METISILLLVVTLSKGLLTSSQTFYKSEQDQSFCEISKTVENQCASYCYKVVKPLLHIAEECQKKDTQVTDLQHKLEEIKIKMAILETSFKEKDNQCKMRVEHANEIFLIKMNNKIKELNSNIQQKEEQIRSLESNAQIDKNDLKIAAKGEKNDLPLSCLDYGKSSEIHMIKLPGIDCFQVKCESAIAGFGWTVIQRRLNGSVNFYRNWSEYREGFGDLKSEFFIGLEKLYRITSNEPHELYILMKDKRSQVRNARYDDFKIGNEQTGYQLISVGNYTGYSYNALRHSQNMKFSTFDQDNDSCQLSNCAIDHHGGWWYNCCGNSNLNGDYFAANKEQRIYWRLGNEEPSTVHMLIRPKRLNFSNIN